MVHWTHLIDGPQAQWDCPIPWAIPRRAASIHTYIVHLSIDYDVETYTDLQFFGDLIYFLGTLGKFFDFLLDFLLPIVLFEKAILYSLVGLHNLVPLGFDELIFLLRSTKANKFLVRDRLKLYKVKKSNPIL